MTYSSDRPSVLIYRERRIRRRVRRVLDAIIAATLLVLALPILAVACVAILIEDGFPIFFFQRRTGRFERLFTIYKLRTMRRDDCGDRFKPRSSADPRVTRVGRILRKTSIDELPQLLNVVRGDMSLIGPRPEMPFVVRGYERWQHLRHLITPGLTCIWQTEKRATISLERPEATVLDVAYINEASPALDLLLLMKTLSAVVSSRGAH
jgi:lipopolysaccharide/colanic/teichoic acid biosynthesis glycosyltransferase